VISFLLAMTLLGQTDPLYHVHNIDAELPRYYVRGVFSEGVFLIPIIGGCKPSQVGVTMCGGRVTDLTLDYKCKSLHNGSPIIYFVNGIAECEKPLETAPVFPRAELIEPVPAPAIPALPTRIRNSPLLIKPIKPIEEDMLKLPSSVR